ncbi:MAG: bifunctional diaminohydroxyphosphoribosylaminopyrimidine deaminase/5-amino-6-(5-phosphoribosylamino)uracil reductase RibD [Candidatus Eremiobacteraeota bacterium]|nr:bifunctional diaminohydroxyphosphoribosylaminopyrimidine deaminase/5-amino-6-(5-phosphoribosylamino)uracil reductase RibD [Candidatus Eremiobacteraeota bacterium]
MGALLSDLDYVFLERAYELAARGIGSTSPNPPVGAVVVRDGRIVGEGYHHRAGEAHAEVNALAQARDRAAGSTAYLSLEPCNHVGRTPACSHELLDAGVARVVVGTIDPNPKTNGEGAAFLRAAGVRVDVAGDSRAKALIEIFAGSLGKTRPYVALKMAMSIDGAVASQVGVRQQLTGAAWSSFVRDLRIAHDAVMVGAGTIRVDDPLLTVRPPHHRLRPYVRVVACETDTVVESSRVFANVDGYLKTIVLAPAGLRSHFEPLTHVADVVFAGDDASERLDLALAMRALREREIYSVLCEGGPTLAARLVADGLVDRVHWGIAPILLQRDGAVPVLSGVDFEAFQRRLRFDRLARVGDDVLLSGTFACDV